MSVYDQTRSNMTTSANTAPVDTRPAQEKSLGELFGDLTRETTDLVRAELNLAKTEMTQKATRAGKDVGMIAAGGMTAYIGVLALVAALIVALGAHTALGYGGAALLVGLVFCIGGALVAMQGISALKHIDPVPQQTLETLKEDQQWAKGQR